MPHVLKVYVGGVLIVFFSLDLNVLLRSVRARIRVAHMPQKLYVLSVLIVLCSLDSNVLLCSARSYSRYSKGSTYVP